MRIPPRRALLSDGGRAPAQRLHYESACPEESDRMASLSRTLAQWVHRLEYADLPAAVVDRAKGVTLQCLASVLIGSSTRPGEQAVKLVTEEEAGVRNGATIMVSGGQATQ